MPDSRILLTGGAGFIGSSVLQALLEEGREVVVVDNFDSFYVSEAKERNLSEVRRSGNFKLIRGGIEDPQTIAQLKEYDFGGIIHLAAKAGVRPSLENPLGYYESNVMGTMQLLELAKQRGISRFIFGSSSSVYGENPNRPWKEADADLSPISPYASSKLAAEQIGHVFSKLYGIQFTALRFFTVFGPRQRPDLAIRKFIELTEARQPITVFGDGGTSRDYTFVGDIVQGILSALKTEELPSFEVFNLGQGQPVTLQEMIETVGEALGLEPIIERKGLQAGDVSHTLADISKAQKVLGYSPQVELRQGVEKLLHWRRNALIAS